MADEKLSTLSERVSGVLGIDLLAIIGNTANTPANFRVQVKNFLNGLAIDLPQTTVSAFKLTANVTANATSATLVGGEFVLQANAASGFTVRDRIGLLIRNEITGANSNVTGQLWGAHVKLDPGTSNFLATNTFGVMIEHTIANTALARAVAPRAYLAIKENAGSGGLPTTFLFDIGAQGNTVSSNNSSNINVVYTRTVDLTVNRTLKVVVNGETIYLHGSNTAPNGV
jgi:hypothetical protein